MNGKICICGGGRTGTVLAAVAGAKGFEISILTGHPERWSNSVTAHLPEGGTAQAQISASSDPQEAVEGAAIILLCLPGYMIRKTITAIAPYLSHYTVVGSVVCSTGFFGAADEILPKKIGKFGFQRVPFISVIEEYGKTARLSGRRSLMKMAFMGMNPELEAELLETFSFIADTPAVKIGYLEASLTNSNPLLHPSRCYSLFHTHENEVFEHIPLFYEEWDDNASRLYVACDNELQELLSVLPLDRNEIPPVLQYYESENEQALTRKIRSIDAFKGIPAPMIETAEGLKPDFSHRFYNEDLPFGMQLIRDLAAEHNIPTPTIDMILEWGYSVRKQ